MSHMPWLKLTIMEVKLALIVILGLCEILQGGATPLDDYVNKFDPTYTYEIINSSRGVNYTLYNLNMTSQTWKPDLQSQPVWWHYLYVTVPDKLDLQNAGFLYIDGGSNNKRPSTQTDPVSMLTTLIAATTNSVAACLKQVPNQPIRFKAEFCKYTEQVKGLEASMKEENQMYILAMLYDNQLLGIANKADPAQKWRKEDAIIAWTWKQFVEQKGADPEILLRLPMTKAGVRAMDTVNDLVQKKHGTSVTRFLVAGASKRGWTTWTVGAVDKRVVAIAPIVMDLLNMVKNLHHFYRSLGGWSFEFADYYYLNFTQNIDSPYMQAMADVIDPISYNDRYINKPKLITSSGGDEFFMIDDAKFYFDQLKGPKYLRQVPNAEHSLFGHWISMMFGIRAFYLSVMKGKPIPEMDWKLQTTSTGGRITMRSDVTPSTVICYYATTLDGKRKDFRLLRGTPGNPKIPELHPVIWFKRPVKHLGNDTFTVEMENPLVGWTAFFIQVTFPGVEKSVLEFTTQTLVIPDTYPFPDCHGEACRGTLV